MAARESSTTRLLLYVLGCLVSLVSYLGIHAASSLERSQTENKVNIEAYRNEYLREIGETKNKVADNSVRIELSEKTADAFSNRISALAEERGRRLGDVEGDVKVLIGAITELKERISRLEGKVEGRIEKSNELKR